ncbi:MAG: lysophospholipid acyltransferase family protein [Mycobacteriales bacterium]
MAADWYRPLVEPALPEPDARVPWRPTGCEITCLGADTPPTVSSPLRLIRLFALGVGFAATLCVAAVAPTGGRLALWAARMGSRAGLGAMGVALRKPSADPSPSLRSPRGVLVVCGHLSWLDILVVQAAYGPMRMLAMKELAAWPVLSWLARRVGTVFIDRDRLLELPGTVDHVATALRAGEAMGAFPEGATTCGRHELAWRPAVFQAAIDAQADVLVLRLVYRASGKPTGHASLLRRETAWSSLWRVLKLRGLSAELQAELLSADAAVTRGALAARAAKTAGCVMCPGESAKGNLPAKCSPEGS